MSVQMYKQWALFAITVIKEKMASNTSLYMIRSVEKKSHTRKNENISTLSAYRSD